MCNKLDYSKILREYMRGILEWEGDALIGFTHNLSAEEVAHLVWLESDIRGENAEAAR